jgi:putative flippase GtrA
MPLFGNVKITGPIAAYVVAFSISFPIGFILSRYIVFPESNLRGRVQLFRYIVATATFILFNYFFLKIFVEWNTILYPTVGYFVSNLTIAVLSYISQRHYTFKTPKTQPLAE